MDSMGVAYVRAGEEGLRDESPHLDPISSPGRRGTPRGDHGRTGGGGDRT